MQTVMKITSIWRENSFSFPEGTRWQGREKIRAELHQRCNQRSYHSKSMRLDMLKSNMCNLQILHSNNGVTIAGYKSVAVLWFVKDTCKLTISNVEQRKGKIKVAGNVFDIVEIKIKCPRNQIDPNFPPFHLSISPKPVPHKSLSKSSPLLPLVTFIQYVEQISPLPQYIFI